MALSSQPSVWADLNLAGQNQQQLLAEEDMKRKKKLMAAGAKGGVMSLMQTLAGSGTLGSMTPMV